ncbi:MAG: hypothetical protein Q7T33_04760 [Dehalococcoidia bacterium]|nr:hypothetical protein [Dehalococcoidia bacterium]
MSIENRDLKPGTKLVARYKDQDYSAEVVEIEEGIRYRLEDGREFKSPSSAGSAVMGGTACNGWSFWSVAGEEAKAPEAKAPTAKAQKAPAKAAKRIGKNGNGLIERLPDEEGLPEGQAKFFCSGCMDAFLAPADIEPIGCPQGHSPENQEAS